MNKIAENIKNTALLPQQTALWYLGQEGFAFKHRNSVLAIDLYLSDYVDKNCSQNVEWKRRYPAPVSGVELDCIDVVLITHSHYDHMDPWTLQGIEKANSDTVFVVPAPCVQLMISYGVESKRIIPAYADEKIEVCGFDVIPVPAAHEVLHKDENGDFCELGYIVETDDLRFFHAGDMCMYDGLAERLTNIDIAFLPINGRDYFRNNLDIIGNFNCEEAVILAKEINAGMLVPIHHDLYDINRVSVCAFAEALEKYSPNTPYHIFSLGERYIFAR